MTKMKQINIITVILMLSKLVMNKVKSFNYQTTQFKLSNNYNNCNNRTDMEFNLSTVVHLQVQEYRIHLNSHSKLEVKKIKLIICQTKGTLLNN